MELIKIYSNDEGARLELFESGQDGKYSYVYFDKLGKSYVSKESIPQSKVDLLVQSFYADGRDFLMVNNLTRSTPLSSNLLGLVLLIIIVGSSFVLSRYDYKLLMLAIPVSLIIIYNWFKKCKC